MGFVTRDDSICLTILNHHGCEVVRPRDEFYWVSDDFMLVFDDVFKSFTEEREIRGFLWVKDVDELGVDIVLYGEHFDTCFIS